MPTTRMPHAWAASSNPFCAGETPARRTSHPQQAIPNHDVPLRERQLVPERSTRDVMRRIKSDSDNGNASIEMKEEAQKAASNQACARSESDDV